MLLLRQRQHSIHFMATLTRPRIQSKSGIVRGLTLLLASHAWAFAPVVSLDTEPIALFALCILDPRSGQSVSRIIQTLVSPIKGHLHVALSRTDLEERCGCCYHYGGGYQVTAEHCWMSSPHILPGWCVEIKFVDFCHSIAVSRKVSCFRCLLRSSSICCQPHRIMWASRRHRYVLLLYFVRIIRLHLCVLVW